MKNLITTLISLTIGLGAGSLVYAQNILQTNSGANNIHKTMVSTESGKKESFQAMIKLGSGDASNCDYTLNSDVNTFTAPTTLTIDGKKLAKVVGLDYSCAQEEYVNSNGDEISGTAYTLSNDGKVYNKADPSEDKISL